MVLRPKSYSYLTDDKNMKIEKQRCIIKRELKFEDYNRCLEATHFENKINQLKNKWIPFKNIKLILKSEQRYRSEKQMLEKKT